MCGLPEKHSETLEELDVDLGLFIPIGETVVPGSVGLSLCGALLEQSVATLLTLPFMFSLSLHSRVVLQHNPWFQEFLPMCLAYG